MAVRAAAHKQRKLLIEHHFTRIRFNITTTPPELAVLNFKPSKMGEKDTPEEAERSNSATPTAETTTPASTAPPAAQPPNMPTKEQLKDYLEARKSELALARQLVEMRKEIVQQLTIAQADSQRMQQAREQQYSAQLIAMKTQAEVEKIQKLIIDVLSRELLAKKTQLELLSGKLDTNGDHNHEPGNA